MLVKVLERKWVIRFFGIALIFAPIFNTIMTLKGSPIASDQTYMGMFWKVLNDGTAAYQVLYASSMGIGAAMLSGSTKAWRYALVLLGGYIVLQFTRLGHSFKNDKMSLVFFAVNVGLFFFIADQLVWKQGGAKPQPQPLPENANPIQTPAPVVPITSAPKAVAQARKRVLVHLEGFGEWALLVGVNGSGVQLRSLVPNPPDMTSREMEIAMKKDFVLRVKFARQSETDFFFEYVQLSSQDVTRLNEWLQQKAAA